MGGSPGNTVKHAARMLLFSRMPLSSGATRGASFCGRRNISMRQFHRSGNNTNKPRIHPMADGLLTGKAIAGKLLPTSNLLPGARSFVPGSDRVDAESQSELCRLRSLCPAPTYRHLAGHEGPGPVSSSLGGASGPEA